MNLINHEDTVNTASIVPLQLQSHYASTHMYMQTLNFKVKYLTVYTSVIFEACITISSDHEEYSRYYPENWYTTNQLLEIEIKQPFSDQFQDLGQS